MEPPFDLAVVGGGSGGFGAALAAARRGLSVVIIEPGPMLGGNSTLGGVNTWEPVVGGPGFHGELYRRLSKRTLAIGLGRTTKHWSSKEPWGFSSIESGHRYEESMRRAGVSADDLIRVTFEPAAMAAEMATMLMETGRVEIRLGAKVVGVEARADRVQCLVVQSPGGETRIAGRFIVDATAEIHVCRLLGCATHLGAEASSTYHEPSAPAAPAETLNGVTLCFRAALRGPGESPAVEPLPSGISGGPIAPGGTSITQYPNGDINLNVLPVMEGMEFHRMGPIEGRRVCTERVHRIWSHMQQAWGFDRYRLVELFPATGVREGPRLIGRHVLTEVDVRAGISSGVNADQWIAVADHALDVHGQGHMCRELTEPFGVPWGTLLPREFSNVAVACRGASFSHIAASSCRLSRTMMQLGHAAGLGIAVACDQNLQLPDVDPALVRSMLKEDDAGFPDGRRAKSLAV